MGFRVAANMMVSEFPMWVRSRGTEPACEGHLSDSDGSAYYVGGKGGLSCIIRTCAA